MPKHRRSLLGYEKRSNGSIVPRDRGGRFSRATLDCDICPNCNQILPRRTIPQYSGSGFIDPRSMRPQPRAICHGCGWDMRIDPTQHALNELMAIG